MQGNKVFCRQNILTDYCPFVLTGAEKKKHPGSRGQEKGIQEVK
jgi:hypothetical protein